MTTARRPLAMLVAAALAASTLSCSKDKAPAPAPPAAKPNLVLITMEATRADHLGCYGDPQAETPGLDRLAREGALLSQAIAVAPLTRPSHASILTGLYPSRHGVRDDDGAGLPAAVTTLAEHLKAQGYGTAASVGAHLLAGNAGLGQGFDSFAGPSRRSRGAAFVVDDAIAAVNRLEGGPFFLWVQLDDPHAPYAPPPGVRARFEKRLYNGEIAWMDNQLTRLFDHLRARGLSDASVIVATADHGEGLGEHGEETHGLLLYDSTLKVPLIVRYPPRIAPGSTFEGLVSGVDLAPTLLELMGLPAMATAQGESSAAGLLGAPAPEREVVYAESLLGERAHGWAPLHALRSSSQKFVDGPEPELYDLKRDPAETINLAPKDPKAVEETWRPALDDALRAIGGASPQASRSGRDRSALPNPRALIAVGNLVMRAELAVEDGQPDQAAALLRQALAKAPGDRAATALLAALRAEPVSAPGSAANTFASQWNLGNALYVKGKLGESAEAFRAALALNPQSAETHYALGNVLAAQGDAAGAEGELRAAVAADPKMAGGWNKLGILLDKTNRRPEALGAFSRALDASPDHPDALFNRAKLELFENRLSEARRDLDRLLAAHGDYAAGRLLEANLCLAENDTAGAKAALNKLLALPKAEPRVKEAARKLLAKLNGE